MNIVSRGERPREEEKGITTKRREKGRERKPRESMAGFRGNEKLGEGKPMSWRSLGKER